MRATWRGSIEELSEELAAWARDATHAELVAGESLSSVVRAAIPPSAAVRSILEAELSEVLQPTLLLTDDDGHRRAARFTLGEGGSVVHVSYFDELIDRHHLDAIASDMSLVLPDDGPVPSPGARELRPYQRAALDAWQENGCRGVLSMATGTGKTYTALVGLEELSQNRAQLVAVVLAPMIHLADQWVEAFEAAGIESVACHTSVAEWGPLAHAAVDLVRARVESRAVLVATYASAASEEFEEILSKARGELVLIADEVHNLGAGAWGDLLRRSAHYRLGLSATPQRHNDPGGTDHLLEYFGGIVYSYALPDAIADGVLTGYRYELTGFELTGDDLTEFGTASAAYAAEMARTPRDLAAVERARQARSDAIDQASGKVAHLRRALRGRPPDRTVVYCADMAQLEAAVAAAWAEGFTAKRFTGQEGRAERSALLDGFETGDVPLLVAIRCLDEGVDIPPAREAYLLRSSGNPAQHVQRRGRLLRPWEGKDFATIHDLVPLHPPRDVAEHERERVEEFAAAAVNTREAMDAFERLIGVSG